MCGIAGAIVLDPSKADLERFRRAIQGCRARGEDSFGVVQWSPRAGWSAFRRLRCEFQDWLEAEPPSGEGPTLYLHTSRAEPTTEWQTEKRDADIPPFLDGPVAVAHNGIICNDDELRARYDLRPSSRVDTAVLPPLFLRRGVWRGVAELRGGAALGVIDARSATLCLYRNFLPLVLAWQRGIVMFASEAQFFGDLGDPFRDFGLWELPPFSGLELSAQGWRRVPPGDGEIVAENRWRPYSKDVVG